MTSCKTGGKLTYETNPAPNVYSKAFLSLTARIYSKYSFSAVLHDFIVLRDRSETTSRRWRSGRAPTPRHFWTQPNAGEKSLFSFLGTFLFILVCSSLTASRHLRSIRRPQAQNTCARLLSEGLQMTEKMYYKSEYFVLKPARVVAAVRRLCHRLFFGFHPTWTVFVTPNTVHYCITNVLHHCSDSRLHLVFSLFGIMVNDICLNEPLYWRSFFF